MNSIMEFFALILCVLPAIATSISITSNGNSPKVKMIGGMMVDVQKGFVPIVPMTPKVETTTRSNYEKSRNITNGINSTKLALNERYRRLIPYMTFYYANDIASPTTDSTRNVEVEKAQIIEAKEIGHSIQRQPKKMFYSSQRNIPRFQGNRLTQYNIASANPTKVFYKDGVPVYQSPVKVSPNVNPFLSDISFNADYEQGRFIPKQTGKPPAVTFIPQTRKPFLNLYNEETPNIRYYFPEKEQAHKYKLVPYDQTPPIKISAPKVSNYEVRKPVVVSTVLVPKELYVRPRPVRPHTIYENNQHVRKQPSIVSESYYEKQRPPPVAVQPLVESGFRPIATPPEYTTESHIYASTQPESPEVPEFEKRPQLVAPIPESHIYASTPESPEVPEFEIEKRPPQIIAPISEEPIANSKPNYYEYEVEQPQHHTKETTSNTVSLASLLNSLQVNKSIPKPITRENVASSIKTLLQVLNVLKSVEHPSETEGPLLSTPKPFIAPKVVVELNKLSNTAELHSHPELSAPELHEEHYLAEVDTPSQHLDDHHNSGVTSQQFPLLVTSDDEGGTPGRPGVDYPVLTTIPPTSFNCKTQRYKGFFADTETRCQVWHYCDLNGGQASFLCPNGTIFSQAGLTCDWWFNVRCASTTQLYVLNESLYKYILPHSPKFPEDYSGPLVDKYLTLKFKEMEEEFNKKKKSKQGSSEDDSDDDDEASEESDKDPSVKSERNTVSEASVIVETPGDSGKVVRLNDD